MLKISELKKIKGISVFSKKIIQSAIEFGIDVEILSKEDNIYYFSYKNKGKYFKNISAVFNTSLSSRLAANKHFTQIALKNGGLKTANGFLIENKKELECLIKNKQLNFPIVIKPNKLMEGIGVSVNVKNIKDAFKSIEEIKKIKRAKSEKILIENYFYGRDYRLFVLEGKVLAVTERIHPAIKGDGRSTIKDLIQKQISSRKGKLKFDSEVKRSIKDADYKINDVLEENKTVRIRHNANCSTGAMAKNVTKKASPYFKQIAIKATKLLGLGVGGIDILTRDISLNSSDYIIVEINGCPNSRNHMEPDIGESVNIPMLVVKNMFKIK